MSTSPHQPQSLSDEITELKSELTTLQNARNQILVLGQSHAGGGTSTNYPTLASLDARIDWLKAKIKAKVDQLNGDSDNVQPGVVLSQYRSDYA
jgi:hypothetical protein